MWDAVGQSNEKGRDNLMWVCDVSVGLCQPGGTDRSMRVMRHTPVACLNHKNVDENKMWWIDRGGIRQFPLNIVFGPH